LVDKDLIEVMREFDEFFGKIKADALRKMTEDMDKKILEILKQGETK
jgi:hypothetical protein